MKKARRHWRRRDFFTARGWFCGLLAATLTTLAWKGEASGTPLLHDLGDDAANASASQADRAGSARGQVKHPAADERAAVVDCDDDAAVATRDSEHGAERQGTV